jgi:hypothetical protein
MSKVVKVEAIVNLFITVPDDTDKDAVYEFLANNVDYDSAFDGISDENQLIRITDVTCPSEEVEMDWDEGEDDDSN